MYVTNGTKIVIPTGAKRSGGSCVLSTTTKSRVPHVQIFGRGLLEQAGCQGARCPSFALLRRVG